MSELLAKSNGQTLKTHSIAVSLMTHELVSRYILSGKTLPKDQLLKEKIQIMALLSGALHDIGKVSSGFQRNLKKNEGAEEDTANKGKFIGPFHHELSWLILSCVYNEPFPMGLSTRGFGRKISHVESCVYWHHPANFDSKNEKMRYETTSEIANALSSQESVSELIENGKSLMKEVLSHEIISSLLGRIKVINDNIMPLGQEKYPEFNIKIHNTTHSGITSLNYTDIKEEAYFKTILTHLVMADIRVSQMSEEQALDYINNYRPEVKTAKESFIVPTVKDLSERTGSQKELADKFERSKISVCGVDTGAGKTSIALLARQSESMTLALPKIFQVDALSETLSRDYGRIFEKETTVTRHHSQSSDTDPGEFSIYVFDRMFSGLFDRRDIESLFSVLENDVVIDEFHEIAQIPKMIQALAVFLHMRKLCSKKTILLSGTPNKSLLDVCLGQGWEESQYVEFFSRHSLPEWKHENSIFHDKVSVSYSRDSYPDVDYIESKHGEKALKDTIIAYNTVWEAQMQKYIHRKLDICHSKFPKTEAKKRIEDILKNYCSPGKSDNAALSSKMLSTSYDLNVGYIFSVASLPCTDGQMIGRGNRKKNKKCVYELHENPEGKMRSIPFKQTHIAWMAHLDEKVNNGKQFTHRSFLSEVYDSFFDDEKNREIYTSEISKSLINNSDQLSKWFPKKGASAKRKASKSAKLVKGRKNTGFREDSMVASYKIIDPDTLIPKGQIIGTDCISYSDIWSFTEVKIATMAAYNNLSRNRALLELISEDFPKNKKKIYPGTSSDTPYMLSICIDVDKERKFLRNALITIGKDCSKEELFEALTSANQTDEIIAENLKELYSVYLEGIGVVKLIKFLEFREEIKEREDVQASRSNRAA